MASKRKADSLVRAEDVSSNVEGVDERAIARLDFIALQLSRRKDRSCYQDISDVHGCGDVNLDEQYDATTVTSILDEIKVDDMKINQRKNLKRVVEIRSSAVELMTSSQYAMKTKKRRTNGTSHLLRTNIGHDYSTLVKACRPSYSTNPDHTMMPRQKEVINRFTPFISCLPLSMVSLCQAIAFYPKPR